MAPAVLEDLIQKVKALDMAEVRAKIAEREAASAG
jgi:thioredoxin reductase (NADPH)